MLSLLCNFKTTIFKRIMNNSLNISGYITTTLESEGGLERNPFVFNDGQATKPG